MCFLLVELLFQTISNFQTFHDLSWWTAENDKVYLDLLSTEPARLVEEGSDFTIGML